MPSAYGVITKHELRDPDGRLIFRGTLNDCYRVMVERSSGTVQFGEILLGWTILPYYIEHPVNQ